MGAKRRRQVYLCAESVRKILRLMQSPPRFRAVCATQDSPLNRNYNIARSVLAESINPSLGTRCAQNADQIRIQKHKERQVRTPVKIALNLPVLLQDPMENGSVCAILGTLEPSVYAMSALKGHTNHQSERNHAHCAQSASGII